MTPPSFQPEKEFMLPSGKVARSKKFKGKHIKDIYRIIGKDAESYMFAGIAVLTTIDNAPITMEDLDEMDGHDVNALVMEIGLSFMSAPKK